MKRSCRGQRLSILKPIYRIGNPPAAKVRTFSARGTGQLGRTGANEGVKGIFSRISPFYLCRVLAVTALRNCKTRGRARRKSRKDAGFCKKQGRARRKSRKDAGFCKTQGRARRKNRKDAGFCKTQVGQDARAGKMPGSVRRGVGQDARARKIWGPEKCKV